MKVKSLKKRMIALVVAIIMISACMQPLAACFKPDEKAVLSISASLGELTELTFNRNATAETVQNALKENLKVTVNYEDGTSEVLSYPHKGLVVASIDTSRARDLAITVTFGGQSTSILVSINNTDPPVVTDLILSPNTIEIALGSSRQDFLDRLIASNFTVIARHDYGEDAIVKLAEDSEQKITVGTIDTAISGKVDVDITFGGKTAKLEVNVVAPTVVGIACDPGLIIVEKDATEAQVKEAFIVQTLYSDGTKETIEFTDTDLEIEGIDTSAVGNITVDITYGSFSVTLTMIVQDNTEAVESISVTAPSPATITVRQGGAANLSSLVLTVMYDDESSKTINYADFVSEGVIMASFNTNAPTAGTDVLIYYGGKTTTFKLIVIAPSAISLNKSEFTVNQNTTLDRQFFETQELTITTTYADGDDTFAFTAANTDITISGLATIDVAVPGIYSLTVVYRGLSTGITVTISGTQVIGYQAPAFISKFNSNIGNHSNPELDFAVRGNKAVYTVGTDNPFVMMPIVSTRNQNEVVVNTPTYKSNIKIEKVTVTGEDTNYTELTGTQRTNVVEFMQYDSGFKGQLQFKEAAAGQTFRITMSPGEGVIAANIRDTKVMFTVAVEEGWNTYNVEDLSRIDNTFHSESVGNNWTSWKNSKNIPEYDGKGVFLHNDISLTREALPDAFFTSGGKIDGWQAFFFRLTPYGETFVVNGNYFTLDASKLPFEDYTATEGRTDIFAFGGMGSVSANMSGAQSYGLTGMGILKNLSAIGNSGVSVNEEDVKSVTLVRVRSAIIDNVVAKRFLTTAISTRVTDYNASGVTETMTEAEYITEKRAERLTIKDCRFYDAFSSHASSWGGDIEIINSVLKGTGGPITLATDIGQATYPIISYDTDSILETAINGNSAWFNVYGLSAMVAQLAALDVPLKQLGNYSMTVAGTIGDWFNVQAVIQINTDYEGEKRVAQGMVKCGDDILINMGTDVPNPVLEGLRGQMIPGGALASLMESPIFMGHSNQSAAIVTMGAELVPGSGLHLPFFLNPLTFNPPATMEAPVWHNVFGNGTAKSNGYIRLYVPASISTESPYRPNLNAMYYMGIVATSRYVGE